jgi:hypothetical protein
VAVVVAVVVEGREEVPRPVEPAMTVQLVQLQVACTWLERGSELLGEHTDWRTAAPFFYQVKTRIKPSQFTNEKEKLGSHTKNFIFSQTFFCAKKFLFF